MHILVIKYLAHIPLCSGFIACLLLNGLDGWCEILFISVANGLQQHIAIVFQNTPSVNVGLALTSDTNHRYINTVVGPHDRSIRFGAEPKSADGEACSTHYALFDKVSSFCHCNQFCMRYKLKNYLIPFKGWIVSFLFCSSIQTSIQPQRLILTGLGPELYTRNAEYPKFRTLI